MTGNAQLMTRSAKCSAMGGFTIRFQDFVNVLMGHLVLKDIDDVGPGP